MRLVRLLLAGLVLSVPALANAGEITLLKGGAIKGDILSVTDSEVTYEEGGVKKSKAIKDVLKVEYREVGKPGAEDKYALVELTDGTALMAGKVLIKKRELSMKLLSGPDVKLPLSVVANILMAGQDDKARRDWKPRIFKTRGQEALVLNDGGTISNLAATIGEGDEKTGETIKAAVDVGGDVVTTKRELTKTHGFIFKHVLDVKAPAVICRLSDTLGNVVMVSALTATEDGIEVTTPSGAKIAFKKDQIAVLDYAKGKLDPLSELIPIERVEKSNLDEGDKPDQWHVYPNTNLDKGPITLGGVVYTTGLAIKPHTELTYDLKGEYRELSMLVGIDDKVSASGATILVVMGDGKEITTVKISSTDKIRFKPLTVSIKDVQKLKIIVKADGLFDISRHLDLADAKVSK